MISVWKIILIHQILFQGMFAVKNIILKKKLEVQIRGKNIEAVISIIFFVFFIFLSIIFSLLKNPAGRINLIRDHTAIYIGIVFLALNLIISVISLINLRDSWRVGVVEDQKTELVTSGIYRFTRNPYFLSYFLMFDAYTIILQNFLLLGLSLIGFFLVNRMIIKEEKYLYSVHGEIYSDYKKNVPRYI